MDAKDLVKAIPTWLVAVVVFAFLLVFVERVYISGKPFWLFGKEFGSVEESVRLPRGSIIIWDPVVRDPKGGQTGKHRSLPASWQICDGTNGVPDLRNHSLRGASSRVDAGADFALRRGAGDEVPVTFVPHAGGPDTLVFYGVNFLCKEDKAP